MVSALWNRRFSVVIHLQLFHVCVCVFVHQAASPLGSLYPLHQHEITSNNGVQSRPAGFFGLSLPFVHAKFSINAGIKKNLKSVAQKIVPLVEAKLSTKAEDKKEEKTVPQTIVIIEDEYDERQRSHPHKPERHNRPRKHRDRDRHGRRNTNTRYQGGTRRPNDLRREKDRRGHHSDKDNERKGVQDKAVREISEKKVVNKKTTDETTTEERISKEVGSQDGKNTSRNDEELGKILRNEKQLNGKKNISKSLDNIDDNRSKSPVGDATKNKDSDIAVRIQEPNNVNRDQLSNQKTRKLSNTDTDASNSKPSNANKNEVIKENKPKSSEIENNINTNTETGNKNLDKSPTVNVASETPTETKQTVINSGTEANNKPSNINNIKNKLDTSKTETTPNANIDSGNKNFDNSPRDGVVKEIPRQTQQAVINADAEPNNPKNEAIKEIPKARETETIPNANIDSGNKNFDNSPRDGVGKEIPRQTQQAVINADAEPNNPKNEAIKENPKARETETIPNANIDSGNKNFDNSPRDGVVKEIPRQTQQAVINADAEPNNNPKNEAIKENPKASETETSPNANTETGNTNLDNSPTGNVANETPTPTDQTVNNAGAAASNSKPITLTLYDENNKPLTVILHEVIKEDNPKTTPRANIETDNTNFDKSPTDNVADNKDMQQVEPKIDDSKEQAIENKQMREGPQKISNNQEGEENSKTDEKNEPIIHGDNDGAITNKQTSKQPEKISNDQAKKINEPHGYILNSNANVSKEGINANEQSSQRLQNIGNNQPQRTTTHTNSHDTRTIDDYHKDSNIEKRSVESSFGFLEDIWINSQDIALLNRENESEGKRKREPDNDDSKNPEILSKYNQLEEQMINSHGQTNKKPSDALPMTANPDINRAKMNNPRTEGVFLDDIWIESDDLALINKDESEDKRNGEYEDDGDSKHSEVLSTENQPEKQEKPNNSSLENGFRFLDNIWLANDDLALINKEDESQEKGNTENADDAKNIEFLSEADQLEEQIDIHGPTNKTSSGMLPMIDNQDVNEEKMNDRMAQGDFQLLEDIWIDNNHLALFNKEGESETKTNTEFADEDDSKYTDISSKDDQPEEQIDFHGPTNKTPLDMKPMTYNQDINKGKMNYPNAESGFGFLDDIWLDIDDLALMDKDESEEERNTENAEGDSKHTEILSLDSQPEEQIDVHGPTNRNISDELQQTDINEGKMNYPNAESGFGFLDDIWLDNDDLALINKEYESEEKINTENAAEGGLEEQFDIHDPTNKNTSDELQQTDNQDIRQNKRNKSSAENGFGFYDDILNDSKDKIKEKGKAENEAKGDSQPTQIISKDNQPKEQMIDVHGTTSRKLSDKLPKTDNQDINKNEMDNSREEHDLGFSEHMRIDEKEVDLINKLYEMELQTKQESEAEDDSSTEILSKDNKAKEQMIDVHGTAKK